MKTAIACLCLWAGSVHAQEEVVSLRVTIETYKCQTNEAGETECEISSEGSQLVSIPLKGDSDELRFGTHKFKNELGAISFVNTLRIYRVNTDESRVILLEVFSELLDRAQQSAIQSFSTNIVTKEIENLNSTSNISPWQKLGEVSYRQRLTLDPP